MAHSITREGDTGAVMTGVLSEKGIEILRILAKHRGSILRKELTKEGLNPARVQYEIERLSYQKLITIETVPGQGGPQKLTITGNGKDILKIYGKE